MPLLEASIPKINSPTPNVAVTSNTVSVEAGVSSFSSVPKISSPQLSLGSLTPTVNVTNTSNLSLAGISTNTNIPTSISQVSTTFGGPSSLKNAFGTPELPSFNTTLPKLNLPPVPKIPGLDKAGILLGAGPKFIANKITKYTTIVPPFAPGLKINMAMVGGAVAIISALSSGNPSAILKSLAEDMTNQAVGDLKNQAGDIANNALDQTGLSGAQDQLKGIQDSATNTVTVDISPTITVSNNTPPTG